MGEILVTGFDAFAEVESNVSESVVRALQSFWKRSPRLRTVVLPTAYAASARELRDLIAAGGFDAIVMLGVARGATEIQLERVALNVADCEAEEHEEKVRRGEPTDARAPVGYWSTLPLAAMHARLDQAGVPARISNHAGTFVCNHAFFVARCELERAGLDVPCGFVHLPDADPGELVHAVAACLEVVVDLRASSTTRQPE